MKPPRVFIRSNHYYLRFSIPGKKHAIDRATGLEADSTDWKKSRHVKLLRLKIKEVEQERFDRLHGRYYSELAKQVRVTFKDLLAQFNKQNEIDRDKPLAEKTLIHRRNAVDFLCKWRDVLPRDFDRDAALELREHGKKLLEPKSLHGYFGVYQTLMKFAEKQGLKNEIAGIRISVPKKAVRQIEEKDLQTVLTFLYHKHPDFMKQVLFLALSMWRVSEGCKLKRSQIKRDGIHYLNTKVGREEIQPVTDPMKFALDGDFGGYVFRLRSSRNVSYYLTRACIYAGVSHITPHDLKRYGVQLLARTGLTDSRTFELAVHHAPTTARTAMDHYAGRDLGLILEALRNAHKPWQAFIDSLPSTSWPEGEFPLANQASRAGWRRKNRGS